MSDELCDSLINSVSSSRGSPPPLEVMVNGGHHSGLHTGMAVKKEDIDSFLGAPQDNSIAGYV